MVSDELALNFVGVHLLKGGQPLLHRIPVDLLVTLDHHAKPQMPGKGFEVAVVVE